jgi:hypothetical protein
MILDYQHLEGHRCPPYFKNINFSYHYHTVRLFLRMATRELAGRNSITDDSKVSHYK